MIIIDISFCFVRADLMDTFKNPLIATEVLELVDLLYGETALHDTSQDEQAKILVQGLQTHYLSATYLSILFVPSLAPNILDIAK